MLFKYIAPLVILITFIVCIFIAKNIDKKNLFLIEGKFSIIGFLLGVFISSLNFKYSNNYLFTLGPLMSISCLLYLRFMPKVSVETKNAVLNFNDNTLKLLNILYWVFSSIALIIYHQSAPYYRPPIFFVFVSFSFSLLSLEIMGTKFKNNIAIFYMIFRIFFISVLIRHSAYFISLYPIGSDPWEHFSYVTEICKFNTFFLPKVQDYYSNYPIMHIYAAVIYFITNFPIKGTMFIIGLVLVFSTIFVYLLFEHITFNKNLALISMLLLNFAEFHLQWSVEIIAMTLGIALYTIILYLIIGHKQGTKKLPIDKAILIVFIFLLVWTHTVAAFIGLLSITALYFGSYMYNYIYTMKLSVNGAFISFLFFVLFFTIMILHWMSPTYPFFDISLSALNDSLTNKAEFLGRDTVSKDTALNVIFNFDSILNISGFLIYILFGIIGSLHYLSRKRATNPVVSIIFMLIILYFVFFAFPVMGIRNILPFRWPAFIYVSFVFLVGTGLFVVSNIFDNKKYQSLFLIIILFTTTFFMITTYPSNSDSPIYGKDLTEKFYWTDSDMSAFKKLNDSYNGYIVVDSQNKRPFSYFGRLDIQNYQLKSSGDIDWSYMIGKLTIWRQISLTRPVGVQQNVITQRILLGYDFKQELEHNSDCIFDSGSSKAYLMLQSRIRT